MATAIVTLCDQPYFDKAKQTINDLRTRGHWQGTIVLIAVDFEPEQTFTTMYEVQVMHFPRMNLQKLLDSYIKNPLSIQTHDHREFKKTTQWEKLHVFDECFKQWTRIMFVDAGLRILDSVENFLCLDWKGKFLALDDTWKDPFKKFSGQLELVNQPNILEQYIESFGRSSLDEKYFLNCLWIYDTNLLDIIKKEELIETMDKYPIWRTNEMGVMNTIITFKHRLWTPLPLIANNGKYLFDWCEYNRPGTRWEQYCALKYPVTL